MVYNPLIIPMTQALMAVRAKAWSRPRSYKDGPRQPKSDKFCGFHDYGHTTEECRHLKSKIERLNLKRIPTRECDTPLIQFDQEEQNGPGTPGNDALVITTLLANYETERVFIDSSSLADILFGEAYDQMQLGDVPLEAVDTSLYGFAGEVVHLRGMISLTLTLGTSALRKTCLLKFLVVDVPSAYNVILERPTLNGPICYNSRKCYVENYQKMKEKSTRGNIG
ncbi:UNVERIFIED_CONTAM: hypothetical protein Sradi_3834300 [Sesamum radiatum]|uniref:Reverse transcriptase domain-containing protein n=1 Tax=Sesamum radiatum TaxID=300843 RepID=A0AAW2Q164_SESRA